MPDLLSILEDESGDNDMLEIDNSFLDNQGLGAIVDLIPWFVELAYYLVSDIMPKDPAFY